MIKPGWFKQGHAIFDEKLAGFVSYLMAKACHEDNDFMVSNMIKLLYPAQNNPKKQQGARLEAEISSNSTRERWFLFEKEHQLTSCWKKSYRLINFAWNCYISQFSQFFSLYFKRKLKVKVPLSSLILLVTSALWLVLRILLSVLILVDSFPRQWKSNANFFSNDCFSSVFDEKTNAQNSQNSYRKK